MNRCRSPGCDNGTAAYGQKLFCPWCIIPRKIMLTDNVPMDVAPDEDNTRHKPCRRVYKTRSGEEVRCNGTGWLAVDRDDLGKIYGLCLRCNGTGKDPGGYRVWDWADAGFYARDENGLPILINGHRVSDPRDPDGRPYTQLPCPSDGRPINVGTSKLERDQRARQRGLDKLDVQAAMQSVQRAPSPVIEPPRVEVTPEPAPKPVVNPDTASAELLNLMQTLHLLHDLDPESRAPFIEALLQKGSAVYLKMTKPE